jgi:hypothetical protein
MAPALVFLATAALVAGGCRKSRPLIARGDAAVVVMQAPLPVPTGVKTVVRETSPPQGGPMPLALTEGGSLAVEGTLASAVEEDLYLVQIDSAAGGAVPASPPGAVPDGRVPPSQQMGVEITPGEGLATRIAVRDAPPAAPGAPPAAAAPMLPTLASSRAAAGKRHGLPNLAVAIGGRYLLSVRRADAPAKGKARGKAPRARAEEVSPTASYLLVLRSSPLGAADEREPNETAAAATVTGPAHSEPQLAGFLGGPGDRDFFRIPFGHLTGPSRLLVELAPSADGAAVISASDSQGRRVAQARGRRGARVVLRGLSASSLIAPGQPDAGFFLVEVATEGPGDPFRRYVLGIRSDLRPEPESTDAGAALASPQ